MKTECWVIGKTNFAFLETGEETYIKRLKHYLPFEWSVIPDIKQGGSLAPNLLKQREGESVLKKLQQDDYLVLLDERGTQFTSPELATQMQHWLNMPFKRIIFLIGGAYGFSDDVYARSKERIALSKMTFSHQMVRLFWVEQLYRAMTILRNESYHHS